MSDLDNTAGDDEVVVPTDPVTGWRTRWTPTPKWVVARIAAVDTIAVAWISHHIAGWAQTFAILCVGAVTAALSSYVTPNRSNDAAPGRSAR